jgi:CRP-like cAMP-binding protein
MQDKATIMLSMIFADADPATINAIRDSMAIKTYPDDTRLITDGAIEDVFYILLEGQADIFQYHDGQAHLIDYLTPGQPFGGLALLLDRPRTGDVIAAGPVTVMEMSRADFERAILPNSAAQLAIVRLILKRMLGQIDRNLQALGRLNQSTTAGPEIFISYSRRDETFVRKLATDLKKQRLQVWLDVFDIVPGQSWARQIGEALDECQLMVLILSPDSMLSENVEDEWNYYLDKHKFIVPILLRPCDVPYRLHKLHYIDFADSPYDSALTRLILELQSRLLAARPPES